MHDDTETVLIAPSTRQAGIIANWVKTQGDCRGFWFHSWEDEDNPILVIFHSYGNTHTSVYRKLAVWRQDRISHDFTISKDGHLRVFDREIVELDDLPDNQPLFASIGRLLGVDVFKFDVD